MVPLSEGVEMRFGEGAFATFIENGKNAGHARVVYTGLIINRITGEEFGGWGGLSVVQLTNFPGILIETDLRFSFKNMLPLC